MVVNDGSNDNTQEAVLKLRDGLTYIAHATNKGVSAARNTGIARSNSPFVAFLDSDDYWLPEKLSVQMRFFKENPSATACQTEEIWIRNGRPANPKKIHRKPSGNIFDPSLKRCFVSPSAVMLKRSLIEEVGLFDETLPACEDYDEDYDLWLRIACRYPVYLLKEHLVVKEGGHPDQLSRRFDGMDRFRIKAMVKLIESGFLNKRQLRVTLEELSHKCRIYGNGCLKRKKSLEASYYMQLPDTLRQRYLPGPIRP
jgi:glycosyltransferase involved in cell wall biosynthesis